MATLKVRLDPTRLSAGPLRATVRVHVTKPAAETVVIPVNYTPR
jgi:hypothetical protein